MKPSAYVALLSVLVACSTESVAPTAPSAGPTQLPLDDASLAGNWTLRSMDGLPLPWWIGDRIRQAADGYKVEVTAEILVVVPPDRVIRNFSISNTNTTTGVVWRGGYADTGSYVATRTGVRFLSDWEPTLLVSISGATMSAVADLNTIRVPPLYTAVYEKH